MRDSLPSERDRVEALRILGLPRRARADEIRARYIEIARSSHPDVAAHDAAASARFQAITAAYGTLRRYHRTLAPPSRDAAGAPGNPDPAWWRAFGHMV